MNKETVHMRLVNGEHIEVDWPTAQKLLSAGVAQFTGTIVEYAVSTLGETR